MPDGAVAAVVTLTVAGGHAAGHLSVYPTGTDRPEVSNLNFGAGDTRANAAVVQLGSGGEFDVYSHTAGEDVVVDLSGVFVTAGAATAGRFVPLEPHRPLDTRLTGQPLAPGSSITLSTAALGVPADASAVAVNLTVDDAAAAGFFVAYSAGTPRPLASNLNVDAAHQTRAALTISPITPGAGDGSGLAIFGLSGGDLIVDVLGYFTGERAELSDDGLFVSTSPHRVLDTRPTRVAARSWTSVPGMPGEATAVIANWTTVDALAPSYVTALPASLAAGQPGTSTVNSLGPGSVVANLAITPNDGGISAYSLAGEHLVVDVAGYFTDGTDAPPVTSVTTTTTGVPVTTLLPPVTTGAPGATTTTTTSPSTTTPPVPGEEPTVLLFVAYNDVWWAEYKVMYEALRALGYQVEVRSSGSADFATSYQTGNDFEGWAADQTGGYAAFTADFQAQFGTPWNGFWNTATDIPLDGRIQDVESMDDYVALVVAGGVGALDYFQDGSYGQSLSSEGGPLDHVSSAAEVEAAAEAIAELALDALGAGTPVLTQCHGAAILAHVEGAGGASLVSGSTATGYPLDPSAAQAFGDAGLTYLIERSVVVDSPNATALGTTAGRGKMVTTRDWFPQTVAHAAQTLDNIVTTYPAPDAPANRSVLVLHGGAVNESSCGPGNKDNDVPCNWPAALPADFTHLRDLLLADSPDDDVHFDVTTVNLTDDAGLPFDRDDAASVRTYLEPFDAVVFFKHWDSGVTLELQSALLDFTDDGGGLVALHHGLYNDAGGKDLLTAAFHIESAGPPEWSGASNPAGGPYEWLNTNYGQFVTTFGTRFETTAGAPSAAMPATPGEVPGARPIPNATAASLGYPVLRMGEEIYHNQTFVGSPAFGRGVGEVNLLLAGTYAAGGSEQQMLTAGTTIRFNPSGDSSEGRLAYLQPGETFASYDATSTYGQMIRNAVYWTSVS